MQLLTLQTVVIVGLLALALLCFHLIIRAMLEEKSLQASPSPSGNGIWTSPVSIIIHGSVEEVFGAITNYKDYSWARGIRYQWERLSATGDPEVGSPGKVELNIEDFYSRSFKVLLTCFNRKDKMIVERSNDYLSFLLEIENVHQVLPVQGHKGICEYRTWTTYRGIVAYFLLYVAKEDLLATQRGFAADLKAFVESESS